MQKKIMQTRVNIQLMFVSVNIQFIHLILWLSDQGEQKNAQHKPLDECATKKKISPVSHGQATIGTGWPK